MKSDMKLIVVAVAIVVIAGGAFIVSSLGKSGDNMSMSQSSSMNMSSDVPSKDKAVSTSTVDIKNFAFGPQAIKVKAGTKVTWTNKDTVKHNAVKDSGEGPDGPLLAQGESYSYTFEKPGTYMYHCDPHRDMHGVVYVE